MCDRMPHMLKAGDVKSWGGTKKIIFMRYFRKVERKNNTICQPFIRFL